MPESAGQFPRIEPHDRRTERDAPVGIGPAGGSAGLHRFSHEAMATVFEVFTTHADRRYAAQAAQAAFDVLTQLERELSRFVPNSDIARINGLRAGQETRVGPATLDCLTTARLIFDLTSGAFDISLGTGLPTLELHGDLWVRAGSAGVQLDLGAIGKGYAVDRMADVLEEWDLGPALLHGGFSSVLALDPPRGQDGWPLTMSEPREPSGVLERLSFRQTALGASGRRKGDHIRDPRTGDPVRGRLAAWAAVRRPLCREAGVAPNVPAAVADALATAFMLMTSGEIQALCDASPGLEAWVLPEAETPSRALLHFQGRGHASCATGAPASS